MQMDETTAWYKSLTQVIEAITPPTGTPDRFVIAKQKFADNLESIQPKMQRFSLALLTEFVLQVNRLDLTFLSMHFEHFLTISYSNPI